MEFIKDSFERNLIYYYLYVIKYTIRRQMDGMTIRGQLFMLLAETLLVIILWLLFWRKKKTPLKRVLHYYLLLVYAGFITAITILRRPFGSRERQINLYLDFGYDSTKLDFWIWWSCIITVLNVLLFMPWGMLIGTFFHEKSLAKRVAITTLIGFFTSLCVECIQFWQQAPAFLN